MPRRKKTEGKYPIEIAEDIFDEGNATLADTLRAVAGTSPARVALVADANVVQRTEGLGLRIGKYFKTHGITLAASPVVVSGGEKIKADGLQSASLVATSLVDARIGANDAVIALGGGTVLDLAGYAAAQTRGGIKVIRMPTTPAAMIDAAFADAAAVNSAAVKDAFSVRCEPAAVLIDPTFARTVLDGVWCAGFGEAVRYAAVCDAALMKRLAKCAERIKARDFDAMRDTVADCVASQGSCLLAELRALQHLKVHLVGLKLKGATALAGRRHVFPHAHPEEFQQVDKFVHVTDVGHMLDAHLLRGQQYGTKHLQRLVLGSLRHYLAAKLVSSYDFETAHDCAFCFFFFFFFFEPSFLAATAAMASM